MDNLPYVKVPAVLTEDFKFLEGQGYYNLMSPCGKYWLARCVGEYSWQSLPIKGGWFDDFAIAVLHGYINAIPPVPVGGSQP